MKSWPSVGLQVGFVVLYTFPGASMDGCPEFHVFTLLISLPSYTVHR